MTTKLNATSTASSKKWVYSMKRKASMLNVWSNNWDKAKTKPSSDKKLLNVLIKIQTKLAHVNGPTVDSSASKQPIWIWFRPALRKTKELNQQLFNVKIWINELDSWRLTTDFINYKKTAFLPTHWRVWLVFNFVMNEIVFNEICFFKRKQRREKIFK